MNAAGGAISLLVGTVLLRLTLTGSYQRYVREEMGPFLAIAGALVVVLGLVTLTQAVRQRRPVELHDDGHDHEDGNVPVGWLLLAPVAALLLVAPPTLGSYGVDRGAQVEIRPGGRVFDRLDRNAGPVPMSLLEFGQRAVDHDGASFNRTSVQLTGFVAGAEEGGFRLARYQIACCAADASPVVVRVTGTSGDPPTRDQWVTVRGTFRPGGEDLAELSATSVVEISPPDDPYE